MATTTLDLLKRLRHRLDDSGGNSLDVNEWLTDDSLCHWSNVELLDYLASAEHEFCTRRPIRDYAEIQLFAGEADYELPDTTYTVEEVRLRSKNIELRPFDHHHELGLRNWNERHPAWYAIDLRELEIRFYPSPEEIDYVDLRIFRFPEQRLSLSVDPEIPEAYRHHLLDWASYLAYRKDNSEVADYDRSSQFRVRFEEFVGHPVPVAHQEILRSVANRRLRTRLTYR